MTSFSLRTFAATAVLLLAAPLLRAQDTRTVTEPTFPAVCSQVQADLTISGGEPSSELNTAHDTSLIQSALTACAQGQAVELVANGSNNAFVIAPIYIPVGRTLLVDGGVTVFGSRSAVDYQIGAAASGTTCGTSDGGSACYPLITMGQNSVGGTSTTSFSVTTPVTGIMGYGVINGRGADKLITLDNQTNPTTYTEGSSSWYDLAVGGAEDNPVLIQTYKVPNVVLYKISLLNSPHFHVRVTGQGSTTATKVTNLTVWGIKLLTPWSAHNTDGIDPTGATNVTITNSVIGDGDDEIAISGSSLSSNFTYSNLLLTSGHGISIGSITTNSVSNVSVSNVNFSGQAADGNQIALRIKSYCGSGGAVTNVTYNGVCVQNTATGIDLDPFYSGTNTTGANCPAYGSTTAPINYQNIYLNTANAKINFQGLSSTVPSYFTLNNVYSNSAGLNLKTAQSVDTVATPSNDNVTLSGSYYPGAWGTLSTAANATGVTEVNNGMPAASFPTSYCANAYPALVGELYANTAASGATINNINKAVTVTLPATVTLNAMLQPTNPVTGYGPATAAATPTAGVQFLDGTTVVGTGTLSANGTLASVMLTNPTAGTHAYTANYVGDSTYAATPFGAATYTGTQNGPILAPTPLVITVNAGPASQLAFSAAPASAISYGSAPGTVSVVGKDVAGDIVMTLTGTVTLTVTGPNGYTATYTTTASGGTATFSSVANPPSVGTYTYTATQGSLTAASVNEAVSATTLTVTANPASRVFDAVDPAFSYTITGFVNNDNASVVSGAPVITSSDVRTSPAGSYPTTVALGTLSAANYVFSLVGGTLMVTGGAPQSVLFAALPNLPSGSSYQLSARATSGLPVTYTASGNATVSGTTLTVTAPGAVTVTAGSAANGNYAAASNVSQSFTAQ